MSTPRKIYDNKTMAKQSSSPVGVNPGPSRVNRSPVQGVGPSRENKSNGHRLIPATAHGLPHGHSNHLHSRPKQETNSGGRLLSANRPTTPGGLDNVHHHGGHPRSPVSSPLLTPRFPQDGARAGLQSANKNKKKKAAPTKGWLASSSFSLPFVQCIVLWSRLAANACKVFYGRDAKWFHA